ncbi:unnamed protein product [Cylindrotheca closterium]|uniref:Uncharacterized protein n=1 Tax=Cylindrotheca closterium TaxID=2856 RepID=A0AAD2GCL1_9STRA|nr:unnamed protein product [Cylindrotheca closterium]
MSASVPSSSTTRRRRRRRRNEFRFQLIRCSDPNRSVSRILDLKNQRITNASLFQLQDVLDGTVLTALLDVFQHFVNEGIKWQSLEIQETEKIMFDVSPLHELLRLANESSLFQSIHLALRSRYNSSLQPDANDGAFLQSIEQNSRLAQLSIDLDGRQSAEDVQSLITLLTVSKTLKRLTLKWHGLQVGAFSEGFAHNSDLTSLCLSCPAESFVPSSSIHDMMTELSLYPTMRLEKLNLSSKGDDELSSALELLLLSQQGLKMLTVSCGGSSALGGFSMAGLAPARLSSNPFDSFFRRLADLTPARMAAMSAAQHQHTVAAHVPVVQDHNAEQQQEQSLDEQLDAHLIENGPLITIGTNMYKASRDQISYVKKALINYPKLRLTRQFPSSMEYDNVLNHCGRYLMNDSNVPLGLWPIALERAACLENHKHLRSTVIYELLHGGVFAGRETYASL